MKFRFIQAQRETFAVGQLCRVLEVSRSGFYSWSSRPQSERDQQNAALLQRIHAVHRENRGVYGSPRVYRALRAAGHRAGRHRVARLMRLEGLRGRAARRFRFIATRRSDFPAAPNLVLRNFRADGPNRLWVADTGQFSYTWADAPPHNEKPSVRSAQGYCTKVTADSGIAVEAAAKQKSPAVAAQKPAVAAPKIVTQARADELSAMEITALLDIQNHRPVPASMHTRLYDRGFVRLDNDLWVLTARGEAIITGDRR